MYFIVLVLGHEETELTEMDPCRRPGDSVDSGQLIADHIQSVHRFPAAGRVVNKDAFSEPRMPDQFLRTGDEGRPGHGGEGGVDIRLVLTVPLGSELPAVSAADSFNRLMPAADGFRVLRRPLKQI